MRGRGTENVQQTDKSQRRSHGRGSSCSGNKTCLKKKLQRELTARSRRELEARAERPPYRWQPQRDTREAHDRCDTSKVEVWEERRERDRHLSNKPGSYYQCSFPCLVVKVGKPLKVRRVICGNFEGETATLSSLIVECRIFQSPPPPELASELRWPEHPNLDICVGLFLNEGNHPKYGWVCCPHRASVVAVQDDSCTLCVQYFCF